MSPIANRQGCAQTRTGTEQSGIRVPLSLDFKGDQTPARGRLRETAAGVGLTKPIDRADLKQMLAVFAQVGIVANELNRTMGLLDLAPEVITPPVEQKLEFVHRTVQENRLN